MDKLRRLLIARGIRQTWLAEQLSLEPSRLHRILTGQRPAPANFYRDAAKVLRVRLGDIKPSPATAETMAETVADPAGEPVAA